MRALIVVLVFLLAGCQSAPDKIKAYLERQCGHSNYSYQPGAHPEGQVVYDSDLDFMYTYRC
jgi:starvation-inducible outer membrane lipoprotein